MSNRGLGGQSRLPRSHSRGELVPGDARIPPIGGKVFQIGDKFCSLGASFYMIGAGILSVDPSAWTIDPSVLVMSASELPIDASVSVIGDNRCRTGASVYRRDAGIFTIGVGERRIGANQSVIGAGVFPIDVTGARPQPSNGWANTRVSKIGDNTPVTGANKYTARDDDTGPDRGEKISRAGDVMSSDNTRMTRAGVCAPHARVGAHGTNKRLTADSIFATGGRLP